MSEQDERPLVTIGLPIYREDDLGFVSESLKSLARVDYSPVEFIVIQDGDSEPIAALVRDILNGHDYRIIVNAVPQGLASCLNLVFDHARGTYVRRMDSDDIIRPDAIASQVRFMEANPELALCAMWAELIDVRGNVLGLYRKRSLVSSRPDWLTPISVNFIHPTVMFRRSVLERFALRYWTEDSELKSILIEDWELWSRVRALGLPCSVMPQVGLQYRIKSSNRQVERFTRGLNIKRRHFARVGMSGPERLIWSVAFRAANLALIRRAVAWAYHSRYQ